MRIGDIVRCVDVPRFMSGEAPCLNSEDLYRVLSVSVDPVVQTGNQILVIPVGQTDLLNCYWWLESRFRVVSSGGYVPRDVVRLSIPVGTHYAWGTVRTVEPGVDDLPLLRVTPSEEFVSEVETRSGRAFDETIFRDENGCFLVYAEDVGPVVNGCGSDLADDLLSLYGHLWCDGSLRSNTAKTSGGTAPRISKRETRGVNEKIVQWLDDENKEDQVTWGIELEFDSWGDFSEDKEFDSEGAWEHASEVLANDLPQTINLASRAVRGWGQGGCAAMSAASQVIEYETNEEFLEYFGIDWDHVVNRLVDQYRDDDDNEYWNHGTLIPGVDVGRDGSVNGPECRTKGPMSSESLREAVRGIFRASGDAEVNTGCSAHIHVKVADIAHRMDTNSLLYQCLMFALTDSIEEWPDSQMERIRCSEARQWFRPNTDAPNRKYSPVFCHPQGTMEFRLWGNAKGERETMKRVEFTLRAIIEGYTAFAESPELLVYDATAFTQALDKAFDQGVPLRSLIPQVPVPVVEVIEEQQRRPQGVLNGEEIFAHA